MVRRKYFTGQHQRSLDPKGRVILPPRHRDLLAEGAVMVRSLDGCLGVYPLDAFDRVAERSREMRERGPVERDVVRTLFAGAVEFEPDRQGRVMIPAPLREYARLDRDVVIAGNDDHAEIWDAQAWAERQVSGSTAMAEGSGIGEIL